MAEQQPIDFAGLADALLQRAHVLVPQWLPGGTQRGNEWVCADLTGGEGKSCSVNLNTGRWADFSSDESGGDLVSLYAAIHNLNQGQAAVRLMRDLGWERAALALSGRVRGGAAASSSVAKQEVGDGRPEPPPADDDGPDGRAQPSTQVGGGGPPAGRRRSLWRAVVPVPAHAPPADFKHWHYTEVQASWEYRFEGQLYGHVVRFATSDGGKEILPHTWCVDESDGRGTMRWHWKQWDVPRPLYVPATLLSGTPADVPVVLVEGEKCALAGHELLGHEFDFVSWPGGANAWAKAGWGWLLGRTVYLWPDCDAKREKLSRAEREAGADPAAKPLIAAHRQPGMRAMVSIGSLLVAEQACTVFMCPMPAPGAVADGWDLADAIAGGWGPEEVRAFIRGAHAFVPPDDAARARAASDGISTPGLAPAGDGEGGGGDPGPDQRWRAALLLTDKGATKAVRENVVLALDGWPERGLPGVAEAAGLVAFNEFTNCVEKTRPTPWGTDAGVWLESDELLMGEWLVREHWLPSMARATLEEAVLMVAQRHAFHPERERVLALRGRWDGAGRLRTWLRRVLLVDDEYADSDALQRYLALVGTWFLMAMVCRVMPVERDGARTVRGPGTKFDFMLILESPQGWGKSTLASVLGGDYFADTGLMIGDKDSYQNIQGVRVYEWGELENLTRQEVTKVKLFISSPKDRFRASFDKRPRDYPRQVVFVGTTNERNYLTDVTGNRRFWPVQLTRQPDIDWLRENLDQLFAEALHRLDAGERFWPTREEQHELFDPQQRSRTVESSLEAEVRRVLYDEDQQVPHGQPNLALVREIGMTTLLTRVGYTVDKQTDVVVKKVGALLHSMGWKVRRLSSAGRPRVYVRPQKDDAPTVREAPEAGASDSSTDPAAGGEEEPADDCPF